MATYLQPRQIISSSNSIDLSEISDSTPNYTSILVKERMVNVEDNQYYIGKDCSVDGNFFLISVYSNAIYRHNKLKETKHNSIFIKNLLDIGFTCYAFGSHRELLNYVVYNGLVKG